MRTIAGYLPSRRNSLHEWCYIPSDMLSEATGRDSANSGYYSLSAASYLPTLIPSLKLDSSARETTATVARPIRDLP